MRSTFYLLLLLLFSGSCLPGKNDDLISARWVFASSNAPELEKIADQFRETYGVDGFQQVFAASKFILRPDHTFDLVLFQNYRHGKWEHRNKKLTIWFEPNNQSLFFTIDTVAYNFMHLVIDSTNFRKLGRMVMPYNNIDLFTDNENLRFAFKLDNERYEDESSDPYSKANNWWRIKPTKPESTTKVKDRVINLVDFHLLIFKDALERDKKVVTYNWFSSPLIVASNGLALKGYRKSKTDWEECFYDSAQAWYGFLTLRAGFEKKLRYPDEITNPFERNKELLRQYRKNLE